jgi:sialate O-acetylesterase
MEMGVQMAKDAPEEINAASYPDIRLFAVPKSPSLTPRPFVQSQWLTCTPENIVKGGWGGFSAVAYYFGRELNKKMNVPIGLIHTSWGGTPAEAWTSEAGIAPVKDFQKQVDAVNAMNVPGALHTPELIEKWVKDNGEVFTDPNVDDSDWESKNLPARFNQIGFAQHRGAVWFRRTVELPDPLPAGDAYLTTGSNDGVDANYVNGIRVGTGSTVLNWRANKVHAGILKPGKNSIVIRFVGTSGQNAGFTAGADAFNLRLGGTVIPLAGAWKTRKGFELKSASKMPDLVEDNAYWPTTLYNGMLYPIMPIGIKGAIWYQGETNIGRGEQYSRLLPAMITDWRNGFKQGDFPFLVVQLANFGGQRPTPSESGWAELREAQAIGVSRVKNAGLAVTVDIGEAKDIHPKNKQEVGRRLALSAFRLAYDQKGEYSGPTFRQAVPVGPTLQVFFEHAEGLELRPGVHSGFAIAGEDGKFAWADVKIVQGKLILSSPSVTAPLYVRYAWDDDPVVTLFNKQGLPAVPFRTK